MSCCADTFLVSFSSRVTRLGCCSVDVGLHRCRCTVDGVPHQTLSYPLRWPCRNDDWPCRNHEPIPAARQRLNLEASAATGHRVRVPVAGWSMDLTMQMSIVMATEWHNSALTWTMVTVKCSQSFADTNVVDS